MDTITTTAGLLKSSGSAQPVMVALMPSEARLIAAAPELLEALKAILDGVEFQAPTGDGVDGVVLLPLYESEIGKARAAIAKATGGDQ
jgi:hypothetical protein